MDSANDPEYLKNEQYRDASNLYARINIHVRYSTNSYGWFIWVLDQLEVPQNARLLELGCGPGEFWRANLGRIPQDWDITLSDFSSGMLNQARANLSEMSPLPCFEVIDAQSIPYPDMHFDAVIANHMLYHVPDRSQALREIRRVIKPGGTFYATTVSRRHMAELSALINRFDPSLTFDMSGMTASFSLETAPAQVATYFREIRLRRYPDTLRITDAEPLVDYILSTTAFGVSPQRRPSLLAFIEHELDVNNGVIEIFKDSGIIIASG